MKKILIVLIASILSIVAIISCNKKADDATATTTTSSYQGAGSKWAISITGEDFTLNKYATAADTTAVLTITGKAQKYSNQFVKLTVSTATGTNAPAVGSIAYGLEIPGYAFFLKPAESSSEPIVMVQAGTCPTTTFNANWIIAKPKSTITIPLTATQDYFGGAAFTFNGASSSVLVSQNQPITGAYLTSGGGNGNGTSTLNFDSASCSNGLLRISDSGSFFDMYFTSSGGALVKFPDGQIIFASPRKSAAVTQAELAGSYSVIVFNDKSSGTDSVFPAKITIPATGSAAGYQVTDLENDTASSDGIVFSNIASTVDSTATQLPAGFFRADLNPVGSTTNGKATCSFSEISGVKVIGCSGYMEDTGSEARRPFFFLARSR